MEQAGKNTILLVRGTAAEPVGLSAFAAAQPDVQVQTVSGLDEARTALGRQHPTLIVMQSDEPGCAGSAPLRRDGGRGRGCVSAAGAAGGIQRSLALFAEKRRVRHDMADGAGNPDPDAAESAAAEKEHAGPNRISCVHSFRISNASRRRKGFSCGSLA